MRAAFKEINKPKVTRRSQRFESPRNIPIDCSEAAKRSRQELTEILDKQKERIEIRRKESLERTMTTCIENSNTSLKSIDNNIDMITSGLKTLTKRYPRIKLEPSCRFITQGIKVNLNRLHQLDHSREIRNAADSACQDDQ